MGKPTNILKIFSSVKVAREVSAILSGNTFQKICNTPVMSLNQPNIRTLATRPVVFLFAFQIFNKHSQMFATSIDTRFFGLDFVGESKQWLSIDPMYLFSSKVEQVPVERDEQLSVKNKIQELSVRCNHLIIWTDNCLLGEEIGAQVTTLCLTANKRLNVHRIRLSQLTPTCVVAAINNIQAPTKEVIGAIKIHRQVEFRVAQVFTRFQTLHLHKLFPSSLG